jgi:hypothetical protein
VAGNDVDTSKALDWRQAQKLLRKLLGAGKVGFSDHAYQAMEDDDLTELDVENVLRAGQVEDALLEHGSWRYRVETNRIRAVLVFCGPDEAIVITVMRKRERGQ